MKVTVFGKPGGGKSTLADAIAKQLGIPLIFLDLLEYHANGERVDAAIFKDRHDKLLEKENWVIDGFGGPETFWKNLDAADTLVYVDYPYWLHYWWVTKRLLLSPLKKPRGWPKGSSVMKGTIASYKYLKLSPKFWNAKLIAKIEAKYPDKTLVWLKSKRDMKEFLLTL